MDSINNNNSLSNLSGSLNIDKIEICINKKYGNEPDKFIDMDDMVKLRIKACQIKTNKGGLGTGVFCYFSKMLMFCLITCEHVISEEMIKNKEKITITYNKMNINYSELDKEGRIQKEILLDKREIFYFNQDIDADITIVELLPSDGIEKERFLEPFYLDEKENLNDIIQNNYFILLQYPLGVENLKSDVGDITEIEEDEIKFKHTINTLEGSSGGPLLYKESKNNYFIFGIHNKGMKIKDKNKKDKIKINKGIILYKILNRLNKKIVYDIKIKEKTRIFGKNFVENNKNNIELFINRERHELTEYHYFNNIGKNEIYIIENKHIIDMSNMFSECESITSLESFKNWDVSKVQNMNYMFFRCKSIESLDPLLNWDVSEVESMSGLFYECKKIKSLEGLEYWNVSKVKDMSYMFSGCESIKSLEGLKNWNVSKTENLSNMFKFCEQINSIEPLKNWNILNFSNVNKIESMFCGCKSIEKSFDSISDLTSLFTVINLIIEPWQTILLSDSSFTEDINKY